MNKYIKNRITINTIISILFLTTAFIGLNIIPALVMFTSYNMACFICDNFI